jgi:hypothetical protein
MMGTKIATPEISLNIKNFFLQDCLLKVRRSLKDVLDKVYLLIQCGMDKQKPILTNALIIHDTTSM